MGIELYINIYRYQECISDCNEAIHLNPKFDKAYHRAFKAYLLQGEIADAKRTIESGLQESPKSLPLFAELKTIQEVRLNLKFID